MAKKYKINKIYYGIGVGIEYKGYRQHFGNFVR